MVRAMTDEQIGFLLTSQNEKLERIALALERIAIALEATAAPPPGTQMQPPRRPA